VRALSVHQPWAEEIASGHQTTEHRRWKTSYRGPLLIVATRRRVGSLPAGVAVCVVDVVGMERDGEEWAWLLERPRRVAPVEIRGTLGLYSVSDEFVRGLDTPPAGM